MRTQSQGVEEFARMWKWTGARDVPNVAASANCIPCTPQCCGSQRAWVRVMRGFTAVGVTLMVIASVAVPAVSKDKTKTFQTGKLLDVTVEDASKGTAVTVSSGTAVIGTPIPGSVYTFRIQLEEDLVYVAEYKAGKRSYKPEWIVNDPIELRVEKDKMFLKRPDGKELEVAVIKRERQN